MKPRWSIVAVVTQGEDILAVARHFKPQNINLPGSSDEPEDKTPVDTLRRALLERTGITSRAHHAMEVFDGELGEPVHAYFVSQWSGKPRAGTGGKAFWAKPHQLTRPTSTFAEDNQRLLRKLMRV